MSEAMTLQPSWAAVLLANLTTAAVKLFHGFPCQQGESGRD